GLRFALGERAYRCSEVSWDDAGRPHAEVSFTARGDHVEIDVRVLKSPLVFRAADAPDPAFDNEHPDIHSDGVQLHLATPGWDSPAAWLAVPAAPSPAVRLRSVEGSRRDVPVSASWTLVTGGFAVRFSVPLSALGPGPDHHFSADVLINDMSPDRERRRGQLVLSGGAGDFVYLQGDRQSPARFLHFHVPATRG
ncbi:MAG: hypothetical protein WKG32_08570, partial [Gemmatimonadaceae bacterium]